MNKKFKKKKASYVKIVYVLRGEKRKVKTEGNILSHGSS